MDALGELLAVAGLVVIIFLVIGTLLGVIDWRS